MGVVIESSGYDQWVEPVDVVTGCGQWLVDILFTSCLKGVSVITRELPAAEVSSKAGQQQSYRGASSLSSTWCYSYGAR